MLHWATRESRQQWQQQQASWMVLYASLLLMAYDCSHCRAPLYYVCSAVCCVGWITMAPNDVTLCQYLFCTACWVKFAAAAAAAVATSSFVFRVRCAFSMVYTVRCLAMLRTLLCIHRAASTELTIQHTHLSCVQFSYKSSLWERAMRTESNHLCAGWKNCRQSSQSMAVRPSIKTFTQFCVLRNTQPEPNTREPIETYIAGSGRRWEREIESIFQ